MFSKILYSGALASLGCAVTFIFGFVLLIAQLMPYIELQKNPEKAVGFVLENHAILSLWNFVIYVVFGVLLAILVIALHRRLISVTSLVSQLSAVMGLVWVSLVIASGMLANVGLARVVELAQVEPELAQSLWLSVITMKEGLGGSNEIVGGLWVLLVSVAFWKNRMYTAKLTMVGISAGTAGIASSIPPLSDLGAVFGLLLIVWFIFLSCVMMREAANASARE